MAYYGKTLRARKAAVTALVHAEERDRRVIREAFRAIGWALAELKRPVKHRHRHDVVL